MTSDFFKDIFDYHHELNQQLADQFNLHLELIPEEPQKLFSHMLNAHQVWNSRILKQPSFQVWQFNSPANYKPIDGQNYADTLRILQEKDLSEALQYVDSRGNAYTNTAQQILFHVNNHFTYHRGQLASRFKALGLTPMISDYIFYRR